MRKRATRKPRPSRASTLNISALPWSYFLVIAVCGCVLAAGFFLAAKQHFTSMDLGMQNSKLRKQLDELESENRRLQLAREIALSPLEITRTARAMGFVNASASASPTHLQAKAVLPTSNTAKNAVKDERSKPVNVSLTADQRPVKSYVPADKQPVKQKAPTETEKKAAKTSAATKAKQKSPEITAVARIR